MLNYEEAIRIVLDTIRPLDPVSVPLPEALGRVLARTEEARWDLPRADNSAMDGYAFSFAGQKEGDELQVAGFVPAGALFQGGVSSGQAVKIMTGAPIPPACDTVIPVEEVEALDGRIRLKGDIKKGTHIRRRGEELRRGEPALAAGAPLHAGAIGLLATAGVDRVSIHPAPRVAILATGNELVDLGQEPGPGQIVNSNLLLIAARLREEGCEVLPLGIARDERKDLSARIEQGLAADMLITTGGVSVGDHDLVRTVLEERDFELAFWKVRIKPGKPVLFGTARGKPVFGLPGNPAATAATFELFARPGLRLLAGYRDPLPPRLRVVLEGAVPGPAGRQRFIWGTLEEERGRYRFYPSTRQSSGQNRSLLGAHALWPMPLGGAALTAGDEAEVILLRLPPGRGREAQA
jgi:molybdopterin molybdotransferase